MSAAGDLADDVARDDGVVVGLGHVARLEAGSDEGADGVGLGEVDDGWHGHRLGAEADDKIYLGAGRQFCIHRRIRTDDDPGFDLVAVLLGDVTDHEASILESLDSFLFGHVSQVGYKAGGYRLGHREVDRRAGIDRLARSGILVQDGAGFRVVGLHWIDAHHQTVVGGGGLGVLERHAREIGRIHGGDSRGGLAGHLGDDRRRRERGVDVVQAIERTEQDQDDGQGHDEGTDQDAAHEQHGRALVGRLVAGSDRRRLGRLQRDLRLGGKSGEGRFCGFGIGRDGRGRPGGASCRGIGGFGFGLSDNALSDGPFSPGVGVSFGGGCFGAAASASAASASASAASASAVSVGVGGVGFGGVGGFGVGGVGVGVGGFGGVSVSVSVGSLRGYLLAGLCLGSIIGLLGGRVDLLRFGGRGLGVGGLDVGAGVRLLLSHGSRTLRDCVATCGHALMTICAVPGTSVSFFIVRRSSLHSLAARDAG